MGFEGERVCEHVFDLLIESFESDRFHDYNYRIIIQHYSNLFVFSAVCDCCVPIALFLSLIFPLPALIHGKLKPTITSRGSGALSVVGVAKPNHCISAQRCVFIRSSPCTTHSNDPPSCLWLPNCAEVPASSLPSPLMLPEESISKLPFVSVVI